MGEETEAGVVLTRLGGVRGGGSSKQIRGVGKGEEERCTMRCSQRGGGIRSLVSIKTRGTRGAKWGRSRKVGARSYKKLGGHHGKKNVISEDSAEFMESGFPQGGGEEMIPNLQLSYIIGGIQTTTG